MVDVEGDADEAEEDADDGQQDDGEEEGAVDANQLLDERHRVLRRVATWRSTAELGWWNLHTPHSIFVKRTTEIV